MKISGFAIGTDGTMLALFDDVEGNIAELRAALRHAADPMFPAGAVRQTAPLHLVIGRFVDWPVLNDLDRARVNLCVERWAAALREHREPQDGTEVPYVGATARLYESSSWHATTRSVFLRGRRTARCRCSMATPRNTPTTSRSGARPAKRRRRTRRGKSFSFCCCH